MGASINELNALGLRSLEFNLDLVMMGIDWTFGHQCNHLGDGMWDIWDNADAVWVSTGVKCLLHDGWNHVSCKVSRVPATNFLLYESVSLNGITYKLNRIYPPGVRPSGWWGLSANYQIDSNFQGAANITYLEGLTVSAQ